jgi:hypothetical protein
LGVDGGHSYFVRVPEGKHGEEEYTHSIAEFRVIGPA